MRPILCDPQHVMVVEGKMRTLKRIAADYPLCTAAFRGGFFYPPTGPGVGLFSIGSRVLQYAVGDWPCLYRVEGKVILAREGAFAHPDWAVAAGPVLLEAGYVRPDLIREPDFASTRPFGRTARTVVGIRPDGKVVLAAFPKATLPAAGFALLGFGCSDGMAFDGGHGTECYAEGKWYCYEGSWPARIPNALLVMGPCQAAPVLPVLSMGSRGSHVRRVQQALVMYDPGPVDGIYGPRTRGAVKRWQQERRLVVTGEVGPYEWHALGVM